MSVTRPRYQAERSMLREASVDCKIQCHVNFPIRSLTLVARFLALLTLVGCSSLPGQSGRPTANAPAISAGLSGRLLYTRDGGLWTLSLRTSETRQIVAAPELGQVTSARWSPDGTRVAYAFAEVRNRRTPVSEIRVTSADGSNTQTLLSSDSGLAFGTPTWAADGEHLYLTRTGLNQGQRVRRVERLTIATGESETVRDDVAPFDVSPDGRWLAFASVSNLGQSMLLVDLITAEERPVVQLRDFDTLGGPRFDSSSNRLFFTGAALVAEAPGSPAEERLATALLGSTAFAHGLPQDVYAVPVAGGPVNKVAAISADEPALAPSPDGTQLAILTIDALATMPIGGGRLTPLLTPGGFGTVDWTP